ncbi:MAG: MarR family transcriptional regulator [Pseudomonadota bacterium]
MSFSRDRSAGFLANHLARLFAAALAERIGPLGLAPAQFMTLLELWEEDGRTQVDLVRRLDVEQATMANTLRRMERDGLVRRTPDPDDRRAQRVWLTDRARALQAPATEAAQALNAAALEALAPEARERFVDELAQVIAGLRAPAAQETETQATTGTTTGTTPGTTTGTGP